jgi:hypothetical protein
MAEIETKTASAVELELPPSGGNISVALEEDAHYLRVTLDKSENFKVAAGERLRDLLVNQFGGNRNALRDWYEEAVAQGKSHRAWKTVEQYLGVVLRHGPEAAADIFAERARRDADRTRDRLTRHREDARAFRGIHHDSASAENVNEINAPKRIVKPEYDRRREWLSDMNVLWFKGDREWQDRWLSDRGLSRTKRL